MYKVIWEIHFITWYQSINDYPNFIFFNRRHHLLLLLSLIHLFKTPWLQPSTSMQSIPPKLFWMLTWLMLTNSLPPIIWLGVSRFMLYSMDIISIRWWVNTGTRSDNHRWRSDDSEPGFHEVEASRSSNI